MKHFFCLLVLVVFSCSEKHEKNLSIHPDKILKFGIDESIAPTSRAMFSYFLDDNEVFAYLNELTNSILIYELVSGDKIQEIKFEFEGSNGVGNIWGFHISGEDSIFVTPKSGGKIYLSNFNGKIFSRYDYSDSEGYTGTFHSKSNLATPLVVEENKLYLSQLPPPPWSQISKELYKASSLGLVLDLTNGEAKSLSAKYPPTYWENNRFPPYTARARYDNKLLYAFMYSNVLYQHDMGSSELKKIKLNFLPDFSFHEVHSPIEAMDRDIKYPCVRNLFYNEDQEVFYLIYYPGDDHPNNKQIDTRTLVSNKPLFTIYVLNKHFKKIAEYTTPRFKYKMDNMFVGKDGLYVSLNNAFNPEMNEDLLQFQLFGFK